MLIVHTQHSAKRMVNSMIYAVDFDGTLCESKFPLIGKPNIPLIEFLKTEKQNGHRLILYTMREGDVLDEAVNWCKQFNLVFDAVNDNLPDQIYCENTRKVYADVYIDDHNAKYGICAALPYIAED